MTSVRDVRRQLGLSQQALASLVGASTESVRAWDSGRRRAPAAVHARLKQALRREDITGLAGEAEPEEPVAVAPKDCDRRIVALRQRLRLSQGELAAAVGAAGKAVVYQWESRKRCPSPVFWARIELLEHARGR